MQDNPAAFGDARASRYDEVFGELPDVADCVGFLAEMARKDPALELAIGTGRVALPLQDRGIEVHGIDASPAMIERLRAKPGGDRIPVTIGNIKDITIGGLIYQSALAIGSETGRLT